MGTTIIQAATEQGNSTEHEATVVTPQNMSEVMRAWAAVLNQLAFQVQEGRALPDGAGCIVQHQDGTWEVDIEMKFSSVDPSRSH